MARKPETTLYNVSEAEKNARQATSLGAFRSINIDNIRDVISEMLGHIGRGDIFEQYTKHDISHVDSMLQSLEWIIPKKTKDVMTGADWLLTVLSVYFHDLGMLVSRNEYENRHMSGFHDYVEDKMFGGESGENYREEVYVKYPDDESRERFLYQEFVRHTHPKRVSSWIMGNASVDLGVSNEAADAVSKLLTGIGMPFRHDLALVCESHHRNDIEDTSIYSISKPYGRTPAEAANVQYSAILLRTADLLHITQDRTPSISYEIISPRDPISQAEWAKQAAVTTVRPQDVRNEDGRVERSKQPDTIEVHATFEDPEGFFGLGAYLNYAKTQITLSYDWAEKSRKTNSNEYIFPWRNIDDSNIKAIGFMARPFKFEIDQRKILDLLTGHTLYNDTDVVVRELVQNSLDAVRLQQKYVHGESDPDWVGDVTVTWDSSERMLVVRDNGTGMSQSVIENHLLKVGSSRYQDPEFQKHNPDFSSISRFGIGVLSCFMVSDDVEIFTSSLDEDKARHLTLRKLHGRYLIKLIDKDKVGPASHVLPHGTEIRLRLRRDSAIFDVRGILGKWIMIPGCNLNVSADGSDFVTVGYESPKHVLLDLFKDTKTKVVFEDEDLSIEDINGTHSVIQIREHAEGSVTLAYAVQWSRSFQDWRFVEVDSIYDIMASGSRVIEHLGTAIEGVRVEFDSPGFNGRNIVAVANAKGPDAPTTDVARNNIESSDEKFTMVENMYKIYSGHIAEESRLLHDERNFSLTWATQEASILLAPLLPSDRSDHRPMYQSILLDQLAGLPLLVAERDGRRIAISVSDLAREDSFWTSEGYIFIAAEHLLREVKSSSSISSLLKALDQSSDTVPSGVMLTPGERSSMLEYKAFEGREVSKVVSVPNQRRVDLLWVNRTGEGIWRSIPERVVRIAEARGYDLRTRRYRRRTETSEILVAREPVAVEGDTMFDIIRTSQGILCMHGSDINTYLNDWLDIFKNTEDEDQILVGIGVFGVVETIAEGGVTLPLDEAGIRSAMGRIDHNIMRQSHAREAVSKLKGMGAKVFDPSAWKRVDFFV